MTGVREAATLPAKPRPSGIRTPASTSSSRPTAARATSSCASTSSISTAHVSAWRMLRMRVSSWSNSASSEGARAARGDAAGEPLADRDANAALDFLFESERCACNELLARGVEEEDRGRVDLEHLARADQQRTEQILEREVRQRRVGDPLQPAYA